MGRAPGNFYSIWLTCSLSQLLVEISFTHSVCKCDVKMLLKMRFPMGVVSIDIYFEGLLI